MSAASSSFTTTVAPTSISVMRSCGVVHAVAVSGVHVLWLAPPAPCDEPPALGVPPALVPPFAVPPLEGAPPDAAPPFDDVAAPLDVVAPLDAVAPPDAAELPPFDKPVEPALPPVAPPFDVLVPDAPPDALEEEEDELQPAPSAQ
ncbi:MAG TPA: hypothetical protein VHC69_12035 [Polyangiaceae bacterium]|nr:hypothetical protein [Polyangiaceae bacterium]